MTYGQIQQSSCLPANCGSIFSSTARFFPMSKGFESALSSSGCLIRKVCGVVIFKALCIPDGITSPNYSLVKKRLGQWNWTHLSR